MRMIASRAGAETDTSRDHDLTDWEALDRFVASLSAEMDTTAGELDVHPSS